MDDTYCRVKKEREQELLEHDLNNIRPSIKITMEHGVHGSLLFLDGHLHRKEDGRLPIHIHTDRYRDYKSHIPIHVRRGEVRSLHDTLPYPCQKRRIEDLVRYTTLSMSEEEK